MAAFDIITLADYKDFAGLSGSERDGVYSGFITASAISIENELGRRLIYRAPPEVLTRDNIVAKRTLQDEAIPGGSITQPNAAGRTLIINVVDPDRSVKGGTVTATGTVAGVSKTVVFDLANGLLQHGLDFFTGALTLTVAGVQGGGTATLSVGSSVGYLEWHSVCGADIELFPLEWPIRSVLELNEDVSRVFAPSTKLVQDTDFLVTSDTYDQGGKITRLSGPLPLPFLPGWRGYKLVHSAGYAAGSAPEVIKDIARRLTKLMADEVSRLGMAGRSDATGSWTRFGAAKITAEMKGALSPYYRRRFGNESGERDWDLEAA